MAKARLYKDIIKTSKKVIEIGNDLEAETKKLERRRSKAAMQNSYIADLLEKAFSHKRGYRPNDVEYGQLHAHGASAIIEQLRRDNVVRIVTEREDVVGALKSVGINEDTPKGGRHYINIDFNDAAQYEGFFQLMEEMLNQDLPRTPEEKPAVPRR